MINLRKSQRTVRLAGVTPRRSSMQSHPSFQSQSTIPRVELPGATPWAVLSPPQPDPAPYRIFAHVTTSYMNTFLIFVLNKGKRESRSRNSIYRIQFRIQVNPTSPDEQTAQS